MRISHVLVSALLFVLTALTGVPGVAAQDSTPAATPGGPSEGYPVAIHEGTCAKPTAEPAWQLDDAVSVGVNQDNPEVIGSGEATSIITGTSGDLDVSLDDLAGSDHIVAVHASPDQFDTIVACGQIVGIKENGKLVIALVPVGNTSIYGVAILEENDDQTHATVYIIPPPNDPDATPVA